MAVALKFAGGSAGTMRKKQTNKQTNKQTEKNKNSRPVLEYITPKLSHEIDACLIHQ